MKKILLMVTVFTLCNFAYGSDLEKMIPVNARVIEDITIFGGTAPTTAMGWGCQGHPIVVKGYIDEDGNELGVALPSSLPDNEFVSACEGVGAIVQRGIFTFRDSDSNQIRYSKLYLCSQNLRKSFPVEQCL